MAKVYTLDKKLLVGGPEIRIGDKIYALDDRKKTVVKILEIMKDGNTDDSEKFTKVVPLAFGENAKEVIKLAEDIPWKAFQELFALIITAVIGEDAKSETKKEDNASSGS